MQAQEHSKAEIVYQNHREHADSDALSTPFMFNPRKPRLASGAPEEGPELVLNYLRYAPWSAKVEMALRHMGLLGSKVLLRDVDILAWFNREHSPVAHLWDSEVPRMIPLLEDVRRGEAIADSTPILKYLEKRFPDAPRLFAGDPAEIERFCIGIDSGLALSARRLFVTKLVLDRRDVLGWAWGGAHHPRLTSGWRALLHQTFMSAALVNRLGLAANVEEGLYQRVRRQMDAAAETLGERRWVFAEFGVADMALAASIASLTWVPWLRSEPRYERLFLHQLRVYARLGMTHTVPSVVRGIVGDVRRSKPGWQRLLGIPYRATLAVYLSLMPAPRPGSVKQVYGQVFSRAAAVGAGSRQAALNDQRPLKLRGVGAKVKILLESAFSVQRQRLWLETGAASGGRCKRIRGATAVALPSQ